MSLETESILERRRVRRQLSFWRILAVIALTFLVPAAGRRVELRTEAEADQFVLSLGLGPVLAGLLRRYGHPMTLERMQRLETAVEQPQRPRLHLVHG